MYARAGGTWTEPAASSCESDVELGLARRLPRLIRYRPCGMDARPTLCISLTVRLVIVGIGGRAYHNIFFCVVLPNKRAKGSHRLGVISR